MKEQSRNILSRFYLYQKNRFPMVVLALSLFPALLSSEMITSSHVNFIRLIMALIASMAYLLHIRVIDEHRDFEHDNLYHTDRPVQIGLISREELKKIGVVSIFVLLIIASISGSYAFFISIIMLFYSYLAGREFFLGEKIRQHFFFYNSVNIIQMLLMQLFVYIIFIGTIPYTTLVIMHFLFTSVGTLVFEFVRKIKVPGDDGLGKDTYTWYIGFNKAIHIYIFLLFLNSFLFFRIAILLTPNMILWMLFAIGMVMISTIFAFVHKAKKKVLTDQLMQLSLLMMYGVFNIAIYFLVSH